MKETNKTQEVADVCDEKCCCDREATPFERLVFEKHELDERIIKLNAFLIDDEKACSIAGYPQVAQMRQQLDVMVQYSGILNTRILTWRRG